MKIIKTLLSLVNFKDKSFSLTPSKANHIPPSLKESINRIGVLHPPILKEIDTDCYIIASGRKRLLYLRDKLNQQTCNCLIMSKDTPLIETWKTIIEEAQQTGKLSVIEQAEFFKKLEGHIDIEEAANIFLPMMGYKSNSFQIKKMLPLAELEGPIKLALMNGTVDTKAALALSAVSFRDRLALFDIISNLQLSVGYQKKFISICQDLEKRTGKTVLSILSCQSISDIINSEANIPQKATNLMRYLAEQLNPRLTEAEKDFKTFVNKLQLPSNVMLNHTPAFENDALNLTFKFNNKNQFLDFWKTLN